MDPLGITRWAWGTDQETETHYAGIADGLAVVLHPEPPPSAGHRSGLYIPLVVDPRRRVPVQRVTDRALPLREAVGAVESALAKAGALPHLANRGRGWRREEPTAKQVDYLRRLDPSAYARARRERWSRGEVSLAITGSLVLPLVRWVAEEGIA